MVHRQSNFGNLHCLFSHEVHELSSAIGASLVAELARSAVEIAVQQLVSTKKRTVSSLHRKPSHMGSLAIMSPVIAPGVGSDLARSNDNVGMHFRSAAVPDV